MITKIKFKKLDLNFVKKNYPILYETITYSLPIGEDAEDVVLKQQIAGLCLEIALKSDGTPDMFVDDLPKDFLGDEEV